MLPAVLTIFFVSGFAGLTYQVIWQRLLTIFSGADLHASTVVVGAFMAGLGCGSLAGGHVADRVSSRTALLLFAGAEMLVAAFGSASSTLFYDVLYLRMGHLSLGTAATGAVLVAALLVPTVLMGMSLPLLARALTIDIGQAAKMTGYLYGANVLGAAAGALAATWVFISQAGLDGSLRIAAALNVACALAAFAIVAFGGRQRLGADRGPTSAASPPLERTGFGFATWAFLVGASGCVGLSLEIVWFRLLGVMVKSTSFTFGTLLAHYLLALGVGGLVGGLIVDRMRRPGLAFLALQAMAGTYALLSIVALNAGLATSALGSYSAYFSQYEPLSLRQALSGLGSLGRWPEVTTTFLRLYVLLPAVLIGPSMVMVGASFTFLQRAAQHDIAHLGRRVGRLMAANIAGSTLGVFLTGWGLLEWMGSTGTLKLVFLVSAGFGGLALSRGLAVSRAPVRFGAFLAAAVTVAGCWIAVPDQTTLWARLHGRTPDSIIAGEDGSGLAVLAAEGRSFGRVLVFANGLGQSRVPFDALHTALGALPVFVHLAPRHALLIGLGSGASLSGMGGRSELEQITSVEIVRPQLRALNLLVSRSGDGGLAAMLADRRIEYVDGDGRFHLRKSSQKFDVIEADALRPVSAYSGNLYSDGYFELVRQHLAPGGLAVTWAATPRVIQTFVKVFPHVWHNGPILLGSDLPLRVDRDDVLQRLRAPGVREYYARSGIDIELVLEPFLKGDARYFDPSSDRSFVDINTDLFPRDEFPMPSIRDWLGR